MCGAWRCIGAELRLRLLRAFAAARVGMPLQAAEVVAGAEAMTCAPLHHNTWKSGKGECAFQSGKRALAQHKCTLRSPKHKKRMGVKSASGDSCIKGAASNAARMQSAHICWRMRPAPLQLRASRKGRGKRAGPGGCAALGEVQSPPAPRGAGGSWLQGRSGRSGVGPGIEQAGASISHQQCRGVGRAAARALKILPVAWHGRAAGRGGVLPGRPGGLSRVGHAEPPALPSGKSWGAHIACDILPAMAQQASPVPGSFG